jgi:hypothetical protein
VEELLDEFPTHIQLHNMSELCWEPPGKISRKTQLFRINGPVVIHAYSGSVLVGGKYLMYDSVLVPPNVKHPPILYGEALNTCGEKTKLIVSKGNWGGSFQHTIQDIVDVMGLFWDELDEDTLFLLDQSEDKKKHWQREEFFDLLNWTSRIVYPQEGYYAGAKAMFVRKDKALPNTMSGILRIRQELRRTLHCEKQPRDKILLWSRTPGSTRWLVNEEAVATTIRSWAISTGLNVTVLNFDPGKISLQESFKLSCSAIGVVFVHGGAQYHALTTFEDTWVVEMVPRSGTCTTSAEFIIPLGLQLHQLGVAGHRDSADGVTANIEDLRQVLDSIRFDLE